MILTDYHLHSQYSWDSKLHAKDLLDKAISLNYTAIALTEHLDLLPWELSVNGLLSLKEYSAYVDMLKTQYPQLKIIKGIEIGDYHRVKDFASALVREIDLELTLGAVHFLSEQINVAVPLAYPLSDEQVKDYYLQNLTLVRECEIDVLAHLGVYKRYYEQQPNEEHALPIVKDIFNVMIEKQIALEINYSPYRKDYGNCLPEPCFLELYKDMGGKLFTIGGDCHHLDHFNDFRHLLPEWALKMKRVQDIDGESDMIKPLPCLLTL
ncbi:MAG: histidinol-phosphatase HisJ family protein [Candidatus Cloacimonadaceae bacterium]|jgi:histidinol-phosphatase (PHP family)